MKNEEWLRFAQPFFILHSSFFILNRNENISFKLWKLIY